MLIPYIDSELISNKLNWKYQKKDFFFCLCQQSYIMSNNNINQWLKILRIHQYYE